MPYIITVLALVIIGVGFTLFQSQPDSLESETVTLDSVTQEIKETTTPNTSTPETITEVTPTSNNTETKETPTKSASLPAPTPSPTPATPPPSAPVDTNRYKNGTYQTSNSYRTPEGTYTMTVGITIIDDTITASTLSFAHGGKDSYSKRFGSGYQSNLIGKDIDTANLSRVGGASLTTRAFNTALDSIRSQAS